MEHLHDLVHGYIVHKILSEGVIITQKHLPHKLKEFQLSWIIILKKKQTKRQGTAKKL